MDPPIFRPDEGESGPVVLTCPCRRVPVNVSLPFGLVRVGTTSTTTSTTPHQRTTY